MNKEDLILKNLNLARAIAWHYYKKQSNKYEFEDLLQICYLGLSTAAEKYDNTKDIKFSTYATVVIHNAILIEFRKYQKNHPVNINIISMNDCLSFNEDITIEETIESDEDIADKYIEKETLHLLRKYINQLPSKYKEVIELYLAGNTQYEIASMLNVSQPAVSRNIRDAINILRRRFNI